MDPDIEMWINRVSKDGLVVSVEPADLKSFWKVGKEMRERYGSNGTIGIDARIYKEACSPSATFSAVWYRASMLEMIAQETGLFGPELPDAARDVVFKTAASFPMKMIEPFGSHGELLDVEAFVKQIQDELGRLGLKV